MKAQYNNTLVEGVHTVHGVVLISNHRESGLNQVVQVQYSPLANCRITTAIYFKLSEPPLRSY